MSSAVLSFSQQLVSIYLISNAWKSQQLSSLFVVLTHQCWTLSLSAENETAGPCPDGDKKTDGGAEKVKYSQKLFACRTSSCIRTNTYKVIVLFCPDRQKPKSLKQKAKTSALHRLVCVLVHRVRVSESVVVLVVMMFPVQQGGQRHSQMLLRMAIWVMMRERATRRRRRRRSWRRRRRR